MYNLRTYLILFLFYFFSFALVGQYNGISIDYTYPNRNKEVLFYPNPSSDYLIIEFPYEVSYMEVQLFSYLGQRIKQVHIQNSYMIDIEVQDLPAGFYFLHIITPDEVFLKQIQISGIMMEYPNN